MDSVTLLGLLAGAGTTFGFLPQLVKILQTKSTHDISLLMYVVITTGILLWLIYGLIIGSVPVIVANSVTLVISSTILILKLKYK
jgi:MtN3 and saliva related transmembrane protein